MTSLVHTVRSWSGSERLYRAVVAVGALALVAFLFPLPPPLEYVLNLAMACLGPGYAVLTRRIVRLYGLPLLVATSISTSILATLVLLYASVWTPARAVVCLLVVTALGVIRNRPREQS